jgi:hypothetical protein
MASGSLYTQVVRVTDRYLGPAADRFISRQIQNHLHIEPTDLTREDLIRLLDWVRVAFSIITEDTAVVEEYISRLDKLTQQPISGRLK